MTLDDARLMMLLDGELDGEERAELERLLQASPEAVAKRASLEVLGDLLRERVELDTRADGIADAVMASLEAELPRRSEERGASDSQRRSTATARTAADAPRPARAANDNARSIFAIAGLAAAAAAALFVWGRTQPTDAGLALAPLSDAPLVAEMPPRLEATAATTETRGAEPTSDAALEVASVEVASVEFGSRAGSVFYVPGDGAGTAVVWINDAGEEE